MWFFNGTGLFSGVWPFNSGDHLLMSISEEPHLFNNRF